MKKTTQKSFSKRLAQYGALTVAIAGVADASGQIIYTDVTPDYNGGINTDYALDLNNDGTVDFNLVQSNSASTYAGYPVTYNSLVLTPAAAGNDALGSAPSSGGNTAYPFALDSGAIISAGQADWNNNGFAGGSNALNANGTLSISSGYQLTMSAGNFKDVTNKYVGLRFDVSGQTYYGWARLDVNELSTSWVIKDYAYNSVANEPITAGQTTLGFGVNELTQIKIVALNRSISLYNLPEDTNYNVLSTTGQSVLTGKTNNDTYIIEANSIANGIYVLELTDENTGGVIRKKIVL